MTALTLCPCTGASPSRHHVHSRLLTSGWGRKPTEPGTNRPCDLADDVVLDRESPLAFEMLGCVLDVATYVLDVSAELGLVHGRRYRLRKQRTQVHRGLNDVAHDQPAIVAQGAAKCPGWSRTRHRGCRACAVRRKQLEAGNKIAGRKKRTQSRPWPEPIFNTP